MNVFVLVMFFLFPSVTTEAQPVKGIVYDRQGFLPSVTVTELGTEDKNKAYTNHAGEFEIRTITPDPVLEFTFVGYAPKRIKIKKERFLKVKLKTDLLKYNDR